MPSIECHIPSLKLRSNMLIPCALRTRSLKLKEHSRMFSISKDLGRSLVGRLAFPRPSMKLESFTESAQLCSMKSIACINSKTIVPSRVKLQIFIIDDYFASAYLRGICELQSKIRRLSFFVTHSLQYSFPHPSTAVQSL